MAAVAAILVFWSERFFFYLQVPRYFLPSFESIGLLVKEKKFKIDFKDSGYGGQFGLSVATILVIFDLRRHNISYQVSSFMAGQGRVTWPLD